jgi:transposase
MGTALRHAESQWEALGLFLDDARVPPDNNVSQRTLRRVALGRKNFLFVHHADAGQNIAGLFSLVTTCEARGINPFAYLAGVLARVQKHPASELDALSPEAWTAPT